MLFFGICVIHTLPRLLYHTPFTIILLSQISQDHISQVSKHKALFLDEFLMLTACNRRRIPSVYRLFAGRPKPDLARMGPFLTFKGCIKMNDRITST